MTRRFADVNYVCQIALSTPALQIYTTFYCRINEPSYIKHLKLDILAAIADETNAYDIATELTEYVNDIDEKLARKAIRTVGKIALEVNLRYSSWPLNLSICIIALCSLNNKSYLCKAWALDSIEQLR